MRAMYTEGLSGELEDWLCTGGTKNLRGPETEERKAKKLLEIR